MTQSTAAEESMVLLGKLKLYGAVRPYDAVIDDRDMAAKAGRARSGKVISRDGLGKETR